MSGYVLFSDSNKAISLVDFFLHFFMIFRLNRLFCIDWDLWNIVSCSNVSASAHATKGRSDGLTVCTIVIDD